MMKFSILKILKIKGEYTNDKYKANHEMSDGYFNMNYPDNINY